MITCQITSGHSKDDVRVFRKIAISLAKNNFESYLLCTEPSKDETIDGVHIISVNYKPKNRFSRILFSWRRLRKAALKINADIYQLHDPELLSLARYLKKKKKTVIFDCHEDMRNLVDKKWIPKPFRKLAFFLFSIKEKKVLSKCDALISVTPHIVERLLKINPNTVLITNYPFLYPVYERTNAQNNIVFAGNLNGYTHDALIDAINKVKMDIKYDIVSSSGYNKAFIEQVSEIDINHCVTLHEKMDFSNLREFYKNCVVGYCGCTYRKNVGYNIGTLGVCKLFEYFVEGMPVICTDFVLWKEIIDKYKCGVYVNPYNTDEIINALIYLFGDKERLKLLGNNARRAAEMEFNWNTQESKLIKLYNSLK